MPILLTLDGVLIGGTLIRSTADKSGAPAELVLAAQIGGVLFLAWVLWKVLRALGMTLGETAADEVLFVMTAALLYFGARPNGLTVLSRLFAVMLVSFIVWSMADQIRLKRHPTIHTAHEE